VRSVIGRFLEHSRVFYFRAGDEEDLYLSSADWMNRNMLRRVELAWPVTDPQMRQRIIDECLVAYLHDGRDAWDLQPDGTYLRVSQQGGSSRHGAQAALMARYSAPQHRTNDMDLILWRHAEAEDWPEGDPRAAAILTAADEPG
jgi:polyphosphate kinase